MMRTLLVALCACALPAMAGAAPVAVFAETDFPYYIASADVGPEFVQEALRRAGIESELLSAAQLADPQGLDAGRQRVLVHVYGNTFPHAALGNLRRFHGAGGCILALGGVPFCHPCVQEQGKWVDRIADLGWEFVSHAGMGTGIWGEARDAESAVHAPGDPLGLGWMPLPAVTPGVVQFPRAQMGLEESRAAGGDHPLGPAPEDTLVPVVSVTRGGKAVGSPVCLIRHGCAEFPGAVDLWAGTTLGASFTLQQQEQIVVAGCANLLEAAGTLTAERRKAILAEARARYVVPNAAIPAPRVPFVERGKPPAREILVLNAMRLDPAERLLALSIQGIVNRRQPRVYLVGDLHDRKWLRVLDGRGTKSRECPDLEALVRAFRKEVPGAVLMDPTQPHTVNLATMLAAVKGAVIATPELAGRFRLPVLEDLRGRFRDPMDGYEWALETLWPRLSHHAAACMEPSWEAPRDYLVQFPMFVFWLDGRCSRALPPREALFLERLMARLDPGAAIYGWWQHGDDGGIGEWRGVACGSKFAKITVCTVGAWNLSVHSGLPAPARLVQKRAPFGSLERKAYVTFLISDGDNFGMNLYAVIERQWNQRMRGRVPVGWGICPTQVELTPAAVKHWYDTATLRDEFVCMDGLGYMYPDRYGLALGDAGAHLDAFLRQSGPYLERLGQRHLWFLDGTGRSVRIAQVLPLDGLFGEYGVAAKQEQKLLGNTAALWSDLNPWEKPWDDVGDLAKRIRERTPAERPAFLFAGVNGFGIGPNEIAAILRQLGPDYVAVTPSEMCHLYRRWKAQGVDANPAPRPPLDLTPPAPPGPVKRADGTLVIAEHSGDPDIGGWFTDPKGTGWVRKRVQVPLPPGAKTAAVRVLVLGKAGRKVRVLVNGHEHAARLATSTWEWAQARFLASELRNGDNEIAYTGNPDGRLHTAGDGSLNLGHSDFGAPGRWSPLSGELMCTLEIR